MPDRRKYRQLSLVNLREGSLEVTLDIVRSFLNGNRSPEIQSYIAKHILEPLLTITDNPKLLEGELPKHLGLSSKNRARTKPKRAALLAATYYGEENGPTFEEAINKACQIIYPTELANPEGRHHRFESVRTALRRLTDSINT